MIELLLGPMIALEAVCEVYMSDTQAASTLFPGQTFNKKSLKLSPEDLKTIEKGSGEPVKASELTYFHAESGDTVYIDRVIGKHEYITYAVGVDHTGHVKGVEILEYREAYGHEIRRASWRAQFAGKDIHSALKPDDDIATISGATLSSTHLTQGVKRVLNTHAVIVSRL